MSNPIAYSILKEEATIIARITGSLRFEHMVSYIKEIRQHPDYQQGLNGFYDLTNLEKIEGELSALSEFAEMLNDHQQVPYTCKTAIVVPDDDDKLHRLVQGLILMTSESKIEHSLFVASHTKLACKYLGLREEHLEQLK